MQSPETKERTRPETEGGDSTNRLIETTVGSIIIDFSCLFPCQHSIDVSMGEIGAAGRPFIMGCCSAKVYGSRQPAAGRHCRADGSGPTNPRPASIRPSAQGRPRGNQTQPRSSAEPWVSAQARGPGPGSASREASSYSSLCPAAASGVQNAEAAGKSLPSLFPQTFLRE